MAAATFSRRAVPLTGMLLAGNAIFRSRERNAIFQESDAMKRLG
jgi:hypothetical protein